METSGVLACEVGRYMMRIDLEGISPIEEEGKRLTVHRRQPDGSWKIVADAFVRVIPEHG